MGPLYTVVGLKFFRTAANNIIVLSLHVKYPYFCALLRKVLFSRHIFVKLPNTKPHEDPPSNSRADSLHADKTDRHEVNRCLSQLTRTRLKILRSSHRVLLCISYGFQNTQRVYCAVFKSILFSKGLHCSENTFISAIDTWCDF